MFFKVLIAASALFLAFPSGMDADTLEVPSPAAVYDKVDLRPESSLEKDSILIGDQVRWSLKLALDRLKDVRLHADNDMTYPSGMEGLTGVVYDTVTVDGEKFLEASVTVTSFDSGSYRMPPFPLYRVREEDGSLDTIDRSSLPLYVNTIQIDTTSFVLNDIKGQMKYPVTFGEVAKWILWILIPLAVLILVIILLKKYMKKDRVEESKPTDPPHVIALRELDRLRSRKLYESGKEKEFYTVLTDTMRQYLEGRYGIKTMERTSNEILQDLKPMKIDVQCFKDLTDLLTLSDFVKFAKYSATREENENAIPVAVKFINATFEAYLEEEKAK